MKIANAKHKFAPIGEILLVALTYWVLARVGQILAIGPGNVTPVWPASGLALVAVLRFGNRVWLGVWLGSFFGNVHAFFDPATLVDFLRTVGTGAAIGVGATLQACLGAHWVRRYCGNQAFNGLSNFFRFIAYQFGACTISATCGTLALIAGGEVELFPGGVVWGTWYLGDAIGIILIAPVLLNLHELKDLWAERKPLWEGFLILCLIAAVASAIFSDSLSPLFLYLLVPLIIWSAVRGGIFAVSMSVLVFAAIGVCFLVFGDYEFFQGNVSENVLSVQGFAVAVLALTGLSVAVLTAQLRNSERQVRSALAKAETSEARYKSLVQYAPEAIVVLDVDAGRFVDANENAEKLFRLPRGELLEKHPADLSPATQPDGTSSWESAQERIAEALGGECRIFEWTHQDATGVRIPCEVRLTRLPSNNKHIVRASIIDVSKRRELERKLRESVAAAEAAHLRLRHALQAGNVGLWDWDMVTGQVFYSDQFKRQLGLGPDEPMTSYQDWETRLHPEDREHATKSVAEYVNQESAQYNPVFRMRHSDGSFRWILSRGELIRDPDGKPIRMLGVHVDITERKKIQDALHEYSVELERRNSELNSFTYVASHDLKAPLRGVRQLATWVEEDCRDILPAESKRHLEQIIERIDRLDTMLGDLLAYSRAGRVHGSSVTVNIRALVEEIVASIAAPDEFKISIDAEVGDIETLRTPLTQVLMNLISNAIKHHDEAFGTVAIIVEEAKDFLEFQVQDDGPGIAPKFHQRVFEVFETLTPGDDGASTGIGLAIVRKIVESYGGQVEIDSDGTRATTIRFTWPKQITLPEGSTN